MIILSLHALTVRNFVALFPRMSGPMFQCGTADGTDCTADRKDRYKRCEEDLNPLNQTELHADPPPAASSEPQLAAPKAYSFRGFYRIFFFRERRSCLLKFSSSSKPADCQDLDRVPFVKRHKEMFNFSC